MGACTGEDATFQLTHNALEQARVVARNLKESLPFIRENRPVITRPG